MHEKRTGRWGWMLGVAGMLAVTGCRPSTQDDDTKTPTGEEKEKEKEKENPAPAADGGVADTDVAVLRLNADGSLDSSFGTNGVAKVDFGPGQGTARDSLWGVAGDAQGRVVLFGTRKGEGTRVDTDRVVARLLPTGAVDTGFATNGFYTLNIGNLGDSARHGFVQADGKIVSSGYLAQPTGVGTQVANRIVLVRLDDAGKPDATFGTKGVANASPFVPADPLRTEWGMCEAYAVGYQDGKYVTTGYGRAAAEGTVDMVSTRFSADGVLDTTWGTAGAVVQDLVGEDDRGRNLVVLPDQRVLMVGSGAKAAKSLDAMAVMLQPNGEVDGTFATDGRKLFDFGSVDEAFFGVASSADGSVVAAAGYRAGGTGGNDDAALWIAPSSGADGFAQAVPLSATTADRFWAVALDANKRAVAVGYVVEGEDSQMAIARYNTDGSADTSFGTGGLVKVNVVASGKDETARGVWIQPDGKIVVAGHAEVR